MSEKENKETETTTEEPKTQGTTQNQDAIEKEETIIQDGEVDLEVVEELPTIEQLISDVHTKDAEIERLKTALIAGDKEIKELQSRLRTVSAAYKKEKEDQEDFKARVQRQMEYRESRRRGDVVKVLFEPLENLRRSESALSKKDPESAKGIEMVVKAFMTGFTELGLEEIAPDGQKFNPNEHQALMAQPTQDSALDDVVLQTYAMGYKIEGLVLKPAQVIVGKYDGPPEAEKTEETASIESDTVETESEKEAETTSEQKDT